MKISLGVIGIVSLAFSLNAAAHAKGIDANRCLTTKVKVAEEIGNVFSRTISFRVDGYDEFVRRVSGTGSYKALDVTPNQIVFDSHFRYDGVPVSSGRTTVKEGGRTVCWNDKCSTWTDASGVSFNPLLWGMPKGNLRVGQTWSVEIPVPWELGPAGKETVQVIAIDPDNDTITLERSGEGDGAADNEIKKVPLVKDKKTYVVDVIAGKAHWDGYTTFRRGIIMSDVLLMQRSIKVSSKEIGESTGIERQYILLNAMPVALL
jgi:hypothetical protein